MLYYSKLPGFRIVYFNQKSKISKFRIFENQELLEKFIRKVEYAKLY